jgi:phage repressor protein C with HTH and peptisase S24 domain
MLIMNRVFRNKILIEHLIAEGVIKNQRDLGVKMGYTNESAFSQVINEKVATPKDFIAKLKLIMPNLNEEWLVNGTGNMTTGRAAIMTPYEGNEPIPDQQQALAQATNSGHTTIIADASNIDLKEIPVEIVEEIEEKVKEEMAIPIITSEIASTPNTNIKKYIRDKSDELKRIYINDLTQGAKVAECVESTSMWPTFQPGDWVFVKFIDKDSIIDGKTYYFDLNTLPTMIRKVKIENDKLRLIAKNPNYGDIIIRLDEVNNIAKIVGMWRSYFGDQYDEIEAVRTKKEQQIDNLIDEIRDSGRRTDRVMEQNYELMQKLMEKLK